MRQRFCWRKHIEYGRSRMKALRINLMDFGQEHLLAQQVLDIFAGCTDPPFQIDSVRQDVTETRSTIKWLDTHAGGCSAGLTTFVFECLPSDSDVVPLLENGHQSGHEQPCIVVTQAESPQQVVHLLDLGATDVWVPPLQAAAALGRAIHCLGNERQAEREKPVEVEKEELSLKQFVGESSGLMAEIRKIPAMARSQLNVLIRGETGTGKELCARAVHDLSPRASKPFIPVNAGALPQELVENELFGHASGAFTSANTGATGLIPQADGGTLFLDEIDSLPLPAQVKLLRFLQDKEYRPLGSQKLQTADVRVIAATNADVETSIRSGRFREDLYYRLCVLELRLPPLRQRGRDVELLAEHFLKQYSLKLNKTIVGITAAAKAKLLSHDWPGNARELENVIARASLFATGGLLNPKDIVLPHHPHDFGASTFRSLKAKAIKAFEVSYLSMMLRAHDGNISRAAEASGKHRRAFWQLMNKHGLDKTASQRAL
jgi:DNA-binding NtrC family response regulator